MNTKDNITITSDQIEQFKQYDNEAKEKAKALLSNDTIKESTLQVVLELLQISRLNNRIKPEMFESDENYKDFLFECIVEPYSFDTNKKMNLKNLLSVLRCLSSIIITLRLPAITHIFIEIFIKLSQISIVLKIIKVFCYPFIWL